MLLFFELGFSACRSPLRALQGVAADAQVVLRDGFIWFRAVRGAKICDAFWRDLRDLLLFRLGDGREFVEQGEA